LKEEGCRKPWAIDRQIAIDNKKKKGRKVEGGCGRSIDQPIHKKRKVLKNYFNDEVASALGTPLEGLHSVLGT